MNWEEWDQAAVWPELPSAYRRIPADVRQRLNRSLLWDSGRSEDDDSPWMMPGWESRMEDGSPDDSKERMEEALARARQITDREERIGAVRRIQNRWANQPYEKNGSHPEQRTKITSRNLRVRSKSEALIAEMLYAHSIPFRYEPVIIIGQYRRSPDFAFLDCFGREHYWEHSGRTRDPGYLDGRRWKLNLYEHAGIVPWDNFIETFDDRNGNLDMQIVENEITGKLMKRLYGV